MSHALRDTSERLVPGTQTSVRQHLMYLRHRFAYEHAIAHLAPQAAVIEVGCGEGYGTNMLAQHVARVVGLDVDRQTVEYAGDKYGCEGCEFRVYDGRRIPFDDASFDAAVSFQVIEHIEDDAHYVAEISRVLRPDGCLFLSTPNGRLRVKPGKRPWNRHHVREYNPAGLASVLQRDFRDVHVLGVRGSDEAQRIELQRVKDILRVVALDPLNLRSVVPESVRQLIIRVIEKRKRTEKAGQEEQSWRERFNVRDYFASEERVDESLDLYGVCRK